ncbi:MAG: hypothetical protein M0P74_10000 [Syntrophales bacterium]|nr:hypothetical protein [Syntrophales bacterium]
MKKAGIKVDLFKLSPDQANRCSGLVKKERDILNGLEGLIGSGNSEALANAAGSLKSNFAQTYFVFGDFSGLQ